MACTTIGLTVQKIQWYLQYIYNFMFCLIPVLVGEVAHRFRNHAHSYIETNLEMKHIRYLYDVEILNTGISGKSIFSSNAREYYICIIAACDMIRFRNVQ